MLERVKETIRKYSMFVPGDRILVGVSGGPDSVVLAHVLKSLAPELEIEIIIAHLNHCLRGPDSEGDAEFVREFAQQLGVPAVVESRNVTCLAEENGLSIQDAAREIRYRFFEEAADKRGCNKLATGHNANDQAETVLFQFLRGSGPAGLAGIPPVRDGWIVRPLVEMKRSDIEDYCRANNLATRLDQTNLKTVYTRNKLRLQLIPLLEKEYNVNLVETLLRTSEIMREQEELLDCLTRAHWKQVCLEQDSESLTCHLRRFLDLPKGFQSRLLRLAWENVAGTIHGLGFVHVSAALDMLRKAQTGSVLDLPLGIKLIKSYDQFTLHRRADTAEEIMNFSQKLNVPGITVIQPTGDSIAAENLGNGSGYQENVPGHDEVVIDLDRVTLPLTVRNRIPGDRFWPLGFHGSKKLKKYLIDLKVPKHERQRIPVVVTADGEIVWVAGLKPDRRWLKSPETKRALKLKLIRNIKIGN